MGTASRASRTWGLAGQWTRRRGVAESMARAVAPPDVPPSVQHLHHSIARPDSPTGSPAGRWPRRLGVAPMLEKAAPYRMAAVLDAAQQDFSGHAGALAHACHLRVLLAACVKKRSSV